MTTAVESAPPTSRVRPPVWRRVLAPGAIGVGVVAWTAALRLRDPHVAGSWGSCPFLVVTGLPCPVCGGLRSVSSLTQGDLGAAVGSNLLVVLALPVALAWWLRWVRRAVAGSPGPAAMPVPSPRVVWAGFVVVVAFGVLRWLPAASWLAP
ncbi:MAG: DUF2752 domain-containing protein [Kineosporiaceae bacterium]